MRISLFAPLRQWARRTTSSMSELRFLASTRDEPPPSRGQVYRLRHWPDLPETMHTADVLGTLSVMSNRPVNRDWILRHSKLKPAALDALVEMLARRGDLEVVDTSKYPAGVR